MSAFRHLNGCDPGQKKRTWDQVQVVSVKPGLPLRVVPLYEKPWGVFTHHTDLTSFCLQPDPCPYCNAQIARRWLGYMPAVTPDMGRRFIVSVTEGAAAQIKTLKYQMGDLGRAVLRFSRATVKKNSKVLVTLDRKLRDDEPVIPAFDPRPSVMIMLGCSEEQVEAFIKECAASQG